MCFLENNLLLRFLPSMMQVGENVGCKGVKQVGFYKCSIKILCHLFLKMCGDLSAKRDAPDGVHIFL